MARPLPVTGVENKVQIPFPKTLGRGKELDYQDKTGVKDLTSYEKQELSNFREGRGAVVVHTIGLGFQLTTSQRACLELYMNLRKEQMGSQL